MAKCLEAGGEGDGGEEDKANVCAKHVQGMPPKGQQGQTQKAKGQTMEQRWAGDEAGLGQFDRPSAKMQGKAKGQASNWRQSDDSKSRHARPPANAPACPNVQTANNQNVSSHVSCVFDTGQGSSSSIGTDNNLLTG